MIPDEVFVNEWNEIHAYSAPRGTQAGWWSVTIIDRPDLPTYYEFTAPGGLQ